MRKKAKLDKGGLSLNYLDHFPGMPATGAVIAVYTRFPAPIGILYYRHTMRNLMEILNVWTHDPYRRQGVATAMLKRLREWYPTMSLCTAEGNKMSTPWLVKHGFKNKADGWFLGPLQKPKKRPRR
jgi:GNAT superfamily N-acetyltransferase